jgi:hypothetical protein
MLFKVLKDNNSCNGGNYKWSLPTKNDDGTWTPGEWTKPIEGDLIACENGYHLADESQLSQWLDEDIYIAEFRGERFSDEEKWVGRQARLLSKVETWNDKTARLFAVWCAREALKLIDDPDPRSIAACDVAERYANGEATRDELTIAWAAAQSAAWSSAWSSARASAGASAGASARVSAGDAAAWASVRSAVWGAQSKKLLEMLGIERS